MEYNASSPDELALVNFCRNLGFVYEGIGVDDYITININGLSEQYLLVYLFEFSSDRKRMSVLLQKKGETDYLLITKGAD